MPIVADASVAIRGDLTGFRQDLNRAKQETGGLGTQLRNILSPKNIIRGAGLVGIGLGIKELAGHAMDAAGAFSQLQQTQRTTDEVFGDSAGVIEEWASRSAEAAGMSQRSVFEAAAVMGQTLTNMGLSAEEAADKTVMLQQRAAEMAIAFGQTPERALLAITAAMRGERDTIEKFGVAIKQVDVNARVAALGLDTSTAAAKKNAEALAVLDLVMEQTNNQAGRFEESQDDVAVKMAQTNAQIDDFMTTQVGPAVASIQLGAVKVGEAFVDTTDHVGDFFDNIFNPEKQAQVQMLADLWGTSFNDASQRIQEGADAAGVDWEDQLSYMVTVTENTATEVAGAGKRIPRGVADSLEEGAEEVGIAAEFGISDPVFDELLAIEEEAGRSGHRAVIEYAKGLLLPQTDVQTAIDTALQVVEDEMSITEEIAYLSGQKTVLEEARGIAEQEGKDAAVLAIDGALALIEDRMILLADKAYDYGFNTVGEYATGIVNNLGVVADAGRQLARNAAGDFTIESEPPNHDSPLYGITKWGGNIVRTIADGIYGNLGTASSASSALAGALVPVMGGGTLGAYGAGMGGSETRNYYLTVQGIPHQVSSPEEMVEKLMELGAMNPDGRLL